MQFSLKNTNYKGLSVPPQAIPSKYKNEVWWKATIDAYENIGLAQIADTENRYSDAYKIVDGSYEYKDVINSSAFLSEVDFLRSQAELDTSLVNYGFIEPLVNQLVGEYIKKPDALIIDAIDPMSTSDYIQSKTDRLWKTVSSKLEQKIQKKLELSGLLPQPQFKSQEEQQQYQQQVQQVTQQETPAEIERDMNKNYRAVYVKFIEKTLEEDKARFDIADIDRECMRDYVITGRCFKHFKVGYDYYYPERWLVRHTFSDLTQKKPEDGDYAGNIQYKSANKIIAEYGHKMTEQQIVALSSSKDYKNHLKNITGNNGNLKDIALGVNSNLEAVPHKDYYAWQNTSYIAQSLGQTDVYDTLFPNAYYDTSNEEERTDLIRVTKVYWVSQQRIGLLNLLNEETGQITTEIVTDEILPSLLKDKGIKQVRNVSIEQNEKDPKPNTIVWTFKPRVWEGTKINSINTDLEEDLYLGVEPLKYQLRGESLTYHTKIPLVGITENNSLVSRLQEDQKDYNIVRNSMRDYMAKELGVFYAFDMGFLPDWIKSQGGEDVIPEVLDIVQQLGMLPVDGSPANTQSRFNQFTKVDMDLTVHIGNKLSLSKAIKMEALEKVGLNPQRMGTPTSQETATGVRQQVGASYAQTETWFDKFANFQKRSAEIHVNVAQYTKKHGIDNTVNYVDSDQIRTFINMQEEDFKLLPMRVFRIIPQNNAKRRSELELIKNIFMNDNTIDKNLESLAEVISSDSVSKVLEAGKRGRKIAEMQQQQQANARQQEIQMQSASDKEKEKIKHDYKMKEIELKGMIDLERQKILALGFAKEKDLDKNGIPDVVEQAKLSIDKLKVKLDQTKHVENRLDAKIKMESEMRNKERELDLKQQEIDAQKYKADKLLEIARENKTRAELGKKIKK